MQKRYSWTVKPPKFAAATFFLALILVMFSSEANASTDSANLATSLLVVSFVLCICILVVSGFTLWQSHRYYLDTVRLSREMADTTMELHQKMMELIYNLKDFLVYEPRDGIRRDPGLQRPKTKEDSGKISGIAESINETEDKIRTLEKTLGRLNEQLNLSFSNTDIPRKIAALGDIEYAVLFKLSQDPKFFEKNSFSSFGASPRVLDSLLSRQLIVFDRDGKAEVPKEVAVALRHSSPIN